MEKKRDAESDEGATKMSREILFRAKEKETRIWFEGDLVRDVDGFGEHRTMIYQILGKGLWQEVFVNPETVCQYTGMNDRNGRKIFDGDILKCHYDEFNPEHGVNSKVFWNENGWAIQEDYSDDISRLGQYDYERGEVVGNIFDNPELLI